MGENIGVVTGHYEAMARRDMAAIVPEIVIVQAEQLPGAASIGGSTA